MKNLINLVVICLFSVFSFGQEININQGTIAQENYFQKIKYEKVKGKIIVDVKIDGNSYKFLFDTGATFALSEKLYTKLGLPIYGSVKTLDANNKMGEVKFSAVPKLELGEISFINSQGLVLNDIASKALDCAGLDGIIGSNMLRNSIVQFDDLNQTIIITNRISNLQTDTAAYQDLVFLDEQFSPYIYSTLTKNGNDIGDYALLDTGDSAFYEMSLKTFKWLKEKDFDVLNVLAEAKGRFSYSLNGAANNTQLFVVEIPELGIEHEKFLDVKAVTTEGEVSRFGTSFFKYGKLTLDYQNKRFYFDPYQAIGKVDEPVRSINPTFIDRKFVVGIVWDKTLESTVNVGDQIMKVDNVDFSNLTFCDAISLDEDLLIKVNSVVVLKDVKTGKLKKIKIKEVK